MKLPWVSREAYDAKCEALRQSDEDRRKLLDRLLEQGGVRPLTEQLAEMLPEPGTAAAEKMLDPISGKVSMEKIRQMAQDDAYKRAGMRA